MSFLEFQINRFLFSSCFSGNFLLAACILLTGGLFAKMSSFFDLLNLVFISKSTFYVVQSTYILPMIHAAWTRERSRVWELLGKKKLAVAGDGRCDSPGYSAKYGTYTMMDTASQLIIDFELVQVTQASSSVGMEKLGFQTLMHRLQTAKLNIATIITDRSPQVKALMKKAYANVNHQFDIWHFVKNVSKKIRKASKKKGCQILLEWLPAISNHLWWSASSCNGDVVLLREKWTSILYHIVNRHTWGGATKFTQCAHRPLSRTEQRKKKWLEAGSTAFAALEAIIEDKTLLKDMAHITGFHHTGNVEVYHSVMTKYCPKREHFDFDAMCARTQLAVLDHNSNVGRPQATTRTGELRYTRAYTKQRGQWVARKVYAKKSYVYLHSLLDDCQSAVEGRLELPSLPERDLPATIAKVDAPDTVNLVQKLVSRMAKWTGRLVKVFLICIFYDFLLFFAAYLLKVPFACTNTLCAP